MDFCSERVKKERTFPAEILHLFSMSMSSFELRGLVTRGFPPGYANYIANKADAQRKKKTRKEE